MNLGKSIKRLRLAKYPDLTQKEFGAMCGLSQGRLSKIENDKKELVDSQLTDIANALGVPVSHIVLKAEVAMKRNELLCPPSSQKMDELAALIKEEERFIYVKSRQDGRIRQALNK